MNFVSCSHCGQLFLKNHTDIVDGKRVCHKCKKGIKAAGPVTVEQMTEEERLAYLEKHPIKSKPKEAAFKHGMRKKGSVKK